MATIEAVKIVEVPVILAEEDGYALYFETLDDGSKQAYVVKDDGNGGNEATPVDFFIVLPNEAEDIDEEAVAEEETSSY